jgi:hypothetical protein
VRLNRISELCQNISILNQTNASSLNENKHFMKYILIVRKLTIINIDLDQIGHYSSIIVDHQRYHLNLMKISKKNYLLIMFDLKDLITCSILMKLEFKMK